MNTLGDIRARFEKAVNEAKMIEWQEKMIAAYLKHRPRGRWVKPNTGEILRVEIDSNDPIEDIESFLSINGINSNDYEISTGNYSGKFESWELKFKKDVNFFGKVLKSGESYGVVSAVDFTNGVKQVIGDKDLTPDSLALSGDYSTQTDIVSLSSSAIKSRVHDLDYQQFCLELINAMQQHKKVFSSVDDIEGINQEFIIKYDLSKYSNKIDAKSVKTIQKDFGEILGGIFMFSIIGKTGTGLSFPKESNMELVDFFFNGLQVSSKAGKGAKASASGYISAIEKSMELGKWMLTPEESKVFNDVLNPLKPNATTEPANTKYLTRSRSSATFSNSINLFNIHLGSGSLWNYWVSSTQLSAGNVNRDAIIQSFIDLRDSGKLYATLSKYLQMSGIKSSSGKSGKLVNGLIKASDEKQASEALDSILDEGLYDILIGLIVYPCSKELAKEINTKYADTLTSLINKALSVKQLYMDLDIKKDQIKFKLKAMENSNFMVGSLNGIDSWGTKSMSIFLA
jgi:hypothetical protein